MEMKLNTRKKEIVNSEGTVYDRFKFLTTPKTDSYGSYFLMLLH